MANYLNTVLYVGVTNDLTRRVWEHKNHVHPTSFTSRYNVHKLVYYACGDSVEDAISYEKQLKSGSRKKKDKLINEFNPYWKDLSNEVGIEQMQDDFVLKIASLRSQ